MKRLALILLMILCATCVFCACDLSKVTYTVTTEKSSYTVTVGQEVDFADYFTVSSSEGTVVPVSADMISAPNADLTKPGTFLVTCTYEGASKTIIIVVESDSQHSHTHEFASATCTTPKTCECGATVGVALGHTEPNSEGKCDRCGVALDVDDDTPTVQGNVMPKQSYDASNHADYDDILYDAITNYDQAEGYLPSTGLPSQGTYNVLVIPVEFSNDKFTTQELSDLNDVFNNKANTGWESVASYYKTSSYGKLNLTFDIADKVTLNYRYQSFDKGYGRNDMYGEDILKLALDSLDASGFDFSKYDYDNNGVLDGVYIIYSAPIDYDNADYYWAYVSAYSDAYDETTYDGLYSYNFLFASVEFMYEDIETSNPFEFSPIEGLKLNATTYIHETGHMLGLDDYYDYNLGSGSDQGLGGADMMDYTVGDHNAYSKLLLGWVKPTVVTSTQTVTISTLESSGQFIIVLLDYDGTYFSEYLIIDLYSATGLNELHAGLENSYLYDGTSFGARIYHVDATIANPYNDEYGSFTDNNNSTSATPLIKLVEADGDDNFESDGEYYQGDFYGYAAADDLWQTGDVFSQIQPSYTRNDGKLVNFDITFDSVTQTSATITITFNSAE